METLLKNHKCSFSFSSKSTGMMCVCQPPFISESYVIQSSICSQKQRNRQYGWYGKPYLGARMAFHKMALTALHYIASIKKKARFVSSCFVWIHPRPFRHTRVHSIELPLNLHQTCWNYAHLATLRSRLV